MTKFIMCLNFRTHWKDVVEHTTIKCHLCTLKSTCRPVCNIDIHFITLLNILMPIICIFVRQMSWGDIDGEFVDHQWPSTHLISVSDIIMHVTIDTINRIVEIMATCIHKIRPFILRRLWTQAIAKIRVHNCHIPSRSPIALNHWRSNMNRGVHNNSNLSNVGQSDGKVCLCLSKNLWR